MIDIDKLHSCTIKQDIKTRHRCETQNNSHNQVKLRSQLFQYTMQTYLLIILLTMGENHLYTNAQVHSETNEIVAYGVSVFRTIIRHQENDGNLINILENIKIDNLEIQQLNAVSSSSILDLYSCRHESGLDFIDVALKLFDMEYKAFENYLLYSGDDNKFPDSIVSIYESGFFDVYTQTSLQWKNITNPMDNPEFFRALVDHYDVMIERDCSDFQSLNQYIYVLTNKILLELIKAYSIIIYSYTNPSMEDNSGHSPTDLKDVIDSFQERILTITDAAVNAINQHSSRYILRHDPPVHVKGVTYDSLDYFIQGYVADQKYFRQDHMCTSSCSEYSDTVYYNYIEAEYFLQNPICTGRIRSCTDSPVERIYFASPTSTRRYNGVSYISNNGTSSKYYGLESPDYGVFPIALHPELCRVCACTCDMVDSPKSIRYVDLRLQRSRSYDAFVITGIRFRIINRVLYLQIQEGLLENGKIIPESVAWKNIDDTDRQHDNDIELFKLDYDNRSFNLTDLTLPNNYAVTMIAFTIVNGAIGLHIGGRNIIDGQLKMSQLEMLSDTYSETFNSRSVFQPGGLDIPTLNTINNSKISEPNESLLNFETSDWDNDVGQNVVPFIDIQDVVTNPPAPIAGIGMHVRYGGSSGGFLAPKLLSINYAAKIVSDDIIKTIASLRPDVETVIYRAILRDEVVVTSRPEVVTSRTPPRKNTPTQKRPTINLFIGVRG